MSRCPTVARPPTIPTPAQTPGMIISARTRASRVRVCGAEERFSHQRAESCRGYAHYADAALAEGPDADVGGVVEEVYLVAFEAGEVRNANKGCY